MTIFTWKAIPVILTASVKFLLSPITSEQLGFTFWQTIFLTSFGGLIGVTVFFWSANYFMERTQKKRAKRIAEGKSKPRKNFTRTNKLIIKVKHLFGLFGIAVVTPALISIPLGSIIAAKFFHHKRKTAYLTICGMTIVWSFLLSSIFYFVI